MLVLGDPSQNRGDDSERRKCTDRNAARGMTKADVDRHMNDSR
jgi:hypothetical protein